MARAREGRGAELEDIVGRILTNVANGLSLVDDVDANKAQLVLEGLEERGLLVRGHKVEELIAERTTSLQRERDEALAAPGVRIDVSQGPHGRRRTGLRGDDAPW